MYSQALQYISYKTTIKKIILMTYCCKQILVLCLLESKQAHVLALAWMISLDIDFIYI